MKLQPEELEQATFVQECIKLGVLFFAPINENKLSGLLRSLKGGDKILFALNKTLSLLGKRKGVNDVFVYTPSKLLHFEFKVGYNKQSKEQKLFEKHVSKFPYAEYHTVYSWQEALKILKENL